MTQYNNYTIADLARITGTRPTWAKLLNDSEWNSGFEKVIVNTQVMIKTTLSFKQIIDCFNSYKKANHLKVGLQFGHLGGRPKENPK